MTATRAAGPPSAATRHVADTLMAFCWVVLVTVMFGGYALLGLIGEGRLSEYEEQFFRAGHAHAGVLTAVGILYALCASRTGLTPRGQVTAFAVYFLGVLTLSGSFFLEMSLGSEDDSSWGASVLAPLGALLLAASALFLAFQLARSRPAAGAGRPTPDHVPAGRV